MPVVRLAVAAAVAVALSSCAQAQSAEEFYKGRQIKMVVGYEVGNDYDIGARLLARYLVQGTAGQPDHRGAEHAAGVRRGRRRTTWR